MKKKKKQTDSVTNTCMHREKQRERERNNPKSQYGLFCLDFICNASLGSTHIDSIHFKDRLLKVTIPDDRIYAVCVCVCA